ncbi:MAG: hypothetical protein ACPGU1_18585 [Myxococcota bacterium]
MSVLSLIAIVFTLAVLPACRGIADAPAVCNVPFTEANDIPDGGLIITDTSIPGVEGWLVDPAPLQRGDHPVLRLWRDPSTCEWAGGWYAWAPREAGAPEGRDAWRRDGSYTATAHTLRAAVLLGADPGAADDAARWSETLEALSPGYALRLSPSRAEALDVVAAACQGAGLEDTVLIVATGAGAASHKGALVLGEEAISHAGLAGHAREVCQEVGLLILALDTSYVSDLEAAWSDTSPPTILWRGSDTQVPDAPRLAPHAGGLLSAALSRHITVQVTGNCLDTVATTPWEWQRVFVAQEEVRQRMLALWWREVGSVELDLGERHPPGAAQRVAERLDSQLPRSLVVTGGDVLRSQRCTADDDCTPLAVDCGLGSCVRLSCVEGRCLATVDEGAPCNDGSVCTADDTCAPQGFCRGTPLECDDASPCTTDSCVYDAGCVHTPAPGIACDDGDLCTGNDRCSEAGLCVGGPIDCSDTNPCTDTWCDPVVGCLAEANHAPCDDLNACTAPDYCQNAVCRGAPLSCVDDDPCTVDACDLEQGCMNPPLPEGSLCDDGDGCTHDDRCLADTCIGLTSTCDDGWDCTLDSCEGGTCIHLPEPGTCITSEGCIPVGSHPVEAPCLVCEATNMLVASDLAEGMPCPDDGVACTTDLCEDGTCMHSNAPGTCHRPDGTCVSVGEAITPCLTCVDTGTGAPAAEGTPCDDDSSCTVEDACDGAGTCTATPIPCCPIATDLACGEVVEGSTASDVASAAVEAWSCLPAPYPAPERAHLFKAPCDGEVIFHLEGQPGQLLFLIRGPPAHAQSPATQCLTGQCDTYTSAGLTQWMFSDQEYLLVVDGLGDSAGSYSLEVLCNCPQPAP